MPEHNPTLATLAANPERIDTVPPEQIPQLIGAAESLKARLWAQLQKPKEPTDRGPAPSTNEGSDRLLTAEEAAKILNVDRRWMWRHADNLPFTRRLGERTVRFSESGLAQWIEKRRP